MNIDRFAILRNECRFICCLLLGSALCGLPDVIRGESTAGQASSGTTKGQASSDTTTQEKASSGTQQGLEPMPVRIVPLGEPALDAHLLSWHDSHIEYQQDDQLTESSLNEIRRIEFHSLRKAAVNTDAMQDAVRFTNDDLLFIDQLEVKDDQLQVLIKNEESLELKVPIEFVSQVNFDVNADSLRELPSLSKEDLLILRNGDRLQGEFQSIDQGQISMQTSLGEMRIAVADAQQLTLNPQVSRQPESTDQFVLLSLKNGASLSVKELNLSATGEMSFQTLLGVPGTFACSEISHCEVFTPRTVSLTELKPSKVTTENYFGQSFPWRVNRSLARGILQSQDEFFPRGFAVRSRSVLTFDIPESAESFNCRVGFDNQSAGKGGVDLRIQLDEEVAWERRLLPEDGLIEIPLLRLDEVQQISLIVDYGPAADIQDQVNWISPEFILQAPAAP